MSIIYKITKFIEVLEIKICRSGSKISPHYLYYQTRTDSSNEAVGDVVDTDDFLSYGASPGFKYKT